MPNQAQVPTDHDSEVQVGGIYASQDSDGQWRVVKVLASEEQIVHVRMYANKFSEQPTEKHLDKLTLGGLKDPAGFGIGHAPLSLAGFKKEKRVLIKVLLVKDEELEGYKLYLEAMKGR